MSEGPDPLPFDPLGPVELLELRRAPGDTGSRTESVGGLCHSFKGLKCALGVCGSSFEWAGLKGGGLCLGRARAVGIAKVHSPQTPTRVLPMGVRACTMTKKEKRKKGNY